MAPCLVELNDHFHRKRALATENLEGPGTGSKNIAEVSLCAAGMSMKA